MQASIPLEDIVFGFCRERDGDVNGFAMISYIPEEHVSGVRRGERRLLASYVGSAYKTGL